ncbi:hypothetical protein [Zunongwangia sp. HRR-M8]|uniref:hypothetical protein n=1 Tax=Zunongwangia sp. HRR-M8 TaxID=3015170 RepID=UPI0022DE5141|nr:hypothetical protein [Zunongwangia sp. HRR-M8]WBL23108.1 hypothetical protein PBT89_03910 [Zunongwangia sp. HRR-M8]
MSSFILFVKHFSNLNIISLQLLDCYSHSRLKRLEINLTELKESICDIDQLTKKAFSEIDFDPIYCIQLIDDSNKEEMKK